MWTDGPTSPHSLVYCVLHDYLIWLFEKSLGTHVPGSFLLDAEMGPNIPRNCHGFNQLIVFAPWANLTARRAARDAQRGESPRGVALETTFPRMITVACEAHQIVQSALIYDSTEYTLSAIHSPSPTYSDASYPSQPHAPFNNSRVLVVGYACSSSHV